ncbi:MAG TPA: Arc family DNA-binding protein [Sedimenticola sp.]|nr:Arc family DNA-binding protein [Sedimenticola sp.]
MRSLSVRNLPDSVYEGIKRMAEANHRSMQEQIRHLLEQEVRLAANSPLSAAGEWRARLASRNLADTVNDVREDRRR